MEFRDNVDDEDLEPVDASFVWSPNPGFPAYLRQVRSNAGVSLRDVAAALGMSYSWLARLETGGSARPPSVGRLSQMADLYGVDISEMLHEAGVRVELPADHDANASLDAKFAAVLLHPDLRPPLFTEDSIHYVPDRVKQQWLAFAEKLAKHKEPAAFLARILRTAKRSS